METARKITVEVPEELLAEAQKANLDIDPATHEQVEQLLARFADYPKAVIERAKLAVTR